MRETVPIRDRPHRQRQDAGRGWLTGGVKVPKVLQSLPDADAKLLLRAGKVNTYERRDIVVAEGDVADSFHIVLDGRAAVRVTTPSGESAIVNILGPDSHFGEVSLLGHGDPRRTASIVALEPVRTLSIPAAVFRDLRERNPRLEQLVSGILAQRVDELSAQVVEAMYDSLEHRVVHRLAQLAEVYGSTSGEVTIPLTQEELSQLVGGARPSVNQVLRGLVEEGLITVGRGRITVIDVDALDRRDS
jgi:CRP/FNR family cyclic AMP-dependent transcriptional regulator